MFRIILLSFAVVCSLSMPSYSSGLKVVTDIKPVHGLVAMVMDGVGAPDMIIESGTSPHDFSLRPSQAAMLQEADVIFWVGEDLTPWLATSIKKLAPNAHSLELLEDTNTILLETHTSDGHDHGSHDPHAWLDPENGKAWLTVIANQLAKSDPSNADTYLANAQRGFMQIDAAIAEAESLLKEIKANNLIVYHDAYRYFEKRFGLSVVGSIALSDATTPSAARVAEIVNTIRTKNVVCIFSEPQFSSSMIATVTEGANVNNSILDPLGHHLDAGAQFYPALLKDMANTIKNCPEL